MIQAFLILSRTEAKVFERHGYKGRLRLVSNVKNPLGRERNKVMQHSKPGLDRMRIMKSTAIQHSLNNEKYPHEEAAVQFIKTVAKDIKNKYLKNKEPNNKFFVFAGPHVSGLLNLNLSSGERKNIDLFINKNISKLSKHDTEKYIKNVLDRE